VKLEYSLRPEYRLERISEILAVGVLRLIEEKKNDTEQPRGPRGVRGKKRATRGK
jgi:hypothetical protein